MILLIHHTNIESHDLFFQPEPKMSTKNPRVRTAKFSSSSWVPECALTSSSCMRSLVYSTP
ncbi:hypothetical protein MAR_019328 [Mya arenaria]|uniref:Uncharacterized protein n=1 Tax=Mya arenaria TaxID=6604 RepID=A0ABY7EJP7_MYAAR|nr:hypothetical protein MAR_019328 [Mya arenaria]